MMSRSPGGGAWTGVFLERGGAAQRETTTCSAVLAPVAVSVRQQVLSSASKKDDTATDTHTYTAVEA